MTLIMATLFSTFLCLIAYKMFHNWTTATRTERVLGVAFFMLASILTLFVAMSQAYYEGRGNPLPELVAPVTPDVGPQLTDVPPRDRASIQARKQHVRQSRVLYIAASKSVSQAMPPAPVRSHWDALADCESGEWDGQGNPIAGSANWHVDAYHDGGLQFLPSTWTAFKPADYPERAFAASREQQILVAERVQAAQGWGAWPVCSKKVGLR